MSTARQLKCAIYTRKSTEEGLDQTYNSLDAQRDACENYIASQKSEGWTVLRERYDDGGYSGGNMDRPALQRLLDDVKQGAVDIIVVYKIDRLSRSLSDFAKLVDIFDANQVTFVSVTQSFNTTTSMGRLTLNILLSFAQFERELSGERVRDKIAASRQRGIWMGGVPPYGYDVVDRRLVQNPAEAALVKEVFTRFIALPSVTHLVRDLRKRGVTSKTWITSKGVHRQGKLIDKSYVYRLLRSPVYAGIAAHKGNHYQGQHEAIIDKELWDQARSLIQTGSPGAKGRAAIRTTKTPSILQGLIFSPEGRPFTPSWTNKGPKVYRYYVNTDAIKIGPDVCEVQRIPAREIEPVIVDQVKAALRSPEILAHTVREVRSLRPNITEARVIEALKSIEDVWENLFPAEQAQIIRTLIERITLRRTGVSIAWRNDGMSRLLHTTLQQLPNEKAA